MKRNSMIILAAGIGYLFSMSKSDAQRTNASAARPPVITVQGSGESQARPDVASVTVGVVSQGQSAQETSQMNANQVQQVIQAIRKVGIPEKDIQTSGYSVMPVYKNNNFAEGIQGYQVSNNVRATVRKLTTVGDVIDAAIGAGANNVHGVAFGLEKRDAAEDAALKEAVASARRKAEVIARSVGLRIVGVREINAAPYMEPRPMMMESFSRGMAASTPVQPGELTISAQVTAIFDVAPAQRRAAANR